MYNYKNFSTLFVSQSFGLDGANGLSPRADKDGNAPLRTVESVVELVKKICADGVERPFTIAIADDYYTDDLTGIDGIENSTVNFYHYRIDEHIPVKSYDKDSGIAVII